MKSVYSEGDWIAVPLRNGGFCAGLLARSARKGKVLVGYFFAPRREVPPLLADLRGLRAGDAVLVARFGDLGIVKGSWPVVGKSDNWSRTEWPSPRYVRKDPISGRAWVVTYSDDDPSIPLTEEPAPVDTSNLIADSIYGAGAIEVVLTKLLG